MENNGVKEQLLETINRFYKEYKLPPMNISDEEWNNFLHVVESHFLVHDIIDEYNHALNIIIRRAFYFVQIGESDEFTIEHLKKALCDLVVFDIFSEEIKAMQEEIDEKGKKYTK